MRATYEVEYRTVGKEDGLIRWVAAKGKGLFEDGRCRRALGTAIDITARKLAAIRQTFLLDLWDQLCTLTEPVAIIDAAVEALGRHFGANRVGYGHIQPDDTTIVLETCYVDGVAPINGPFPLSAFGRTTSHASARGKTVVYDDIAR